MRILTRHPGWTALGVYVVVACAWTWPMVVSDTPLPARNFDAFCVQWVAAAATRLDLSLTDPLTQWPLGNSLARSDSFVYLALARVLTPLLGVDRLVCALALLGPVASAWAAERTARLDFQVPAPWSLVAGLVFAFNGLAATMVLEGHVYLLLVPWLPLLLGALTRIGDARAGLVAGGWWAMCLLTSAYVGIGASLVVAVYGVVALVRRELGTAGWGALTVVCAAVGGAYALWFVSAPDAYAGLQMGVASATSEMTYGSARIGLLFGWSPVVDDAGHSFWPSLSASGFALCLYAGVVRGAPRRVLALGILALALSLGPQLDAYRPGDIGLPWLLDPLARAGLGERFRFPSRLLLPASLAFGIVAAGVLARLQVWAPRHARVYALAVALEAVFGAGLPFRTRSFEGSLPEAYAAAPEGWAVLDLVPTFAGPGEVDLAFYVDRLACRWQAFHQRPILAQCVDTRPYAGLAAAVDAEVLTRMVEGATDGLADQLRAVGIGAVTVRPDLFAAADREAVALGLTAAFGERAAASRNGGDPLELWRVPGAEGEPPADQDRRAALSALLGGG